MTKRLLSVVLAAFMVLALVPMSIFARTVTPDDVRPSVTYYGSNTTVDNPQVGGSFMWFLGVEEGSSLDSAQILVEFDARYLQVVGTSYSVSTCLSRQITNGTITDSNNYDCFFTDNYAGATGNMPVGEEGKTYERIMFASQGYSLGGLNAGGNICRLKFEWVAVPPNGRLPLTISVVESNCFTTEEQALACDGNPSYAHATVTCNNENSYVEVTNSSYVPVVPETRDVTFNGEIVNAGEVAVDGTFTWALSVSDNSGMMSGHWFVDFNEDYLTTTKVEYEFAGSVVDQIYATYNEDEEPTDDTFSDMPVFVPNINYPLQMQAAEGNAYGLVAGNYYNDIGMRIGTFDHMGLQQGGQMFRYTYKWTAVPAVEDLMQDDNGYYLPMEFIVAEAKYRVENTAQYGVYDNVINVPGKIYVEVPAEPETREVTFTGEIVNAGEVAVDGTFTWALSVSDNSGMMSGHWFVDFNEDYLTTTKVEYEFAGSVVDQIYATYNEDEEPTDDTFSDMPVFVPNINYPLQMQAAEGNAYGLVAGNYYNDIGMRIGTFDYMGLQQGGQMFRYTYKWTAVPAVEDLMQDDNGYYLPMEFVVAEAKYRVENTAQYGVYDAINNVPGKIYVEIPAVPETYTITWVIDGVSETETYAAGETPTHAVPTKPADAQYTYTFAGWDPEIVPVTGDATYTATWTTTPVEYTITWVIDGVSETETYAYGETPAHAVPTKPADAQYTYTFAGWDPEIVPVTGDATYTATWTTTPRNYTITIYYLRYSDGLGDWVALQSSKTITVAYGAEYDVNDQIPAEIDGYILDHTEGVLAGTMPAENVEINAYYVVPPYEPVAPTVEGVKAEIRERAAADGKNDLRFIFKVTFNDSYVVEDGINYGPTEEYYKITKFYVEMLQGTSTTPKTLVCKALWTVAADNYQFTVVIKGIPESANSKVYTMTPFVDYAMGDVTGTATNDPLVASVDSVLND